MGLNLLFHLPLLQCILLSGLDSLLLVLLVPSLGLRRGELLTVSPAAPHPSGPAELRAAGSPRDAQSGSV